MTRELPDFDELLLLAQQDPEALERLRCELVEDLIDNAGDDTLKRRLRALQCRIDLERQRCNSPMSACLRLSQMMHDSLLDLRDSLQAPAVFRQQRRENRPATIIAFKSVSHGEPRRD